VRQRVGDNVFNNLLFFVHGQHNHEGPDTSGISAVPVNHDYYDYMVEQMVDATVEALTESKRVRRSSTGWHHPAPPCHTLSLLVADRLVMLLPSMLHHDIDDDDAPAAIIITIISTVALSTLMRRLTPSSSLAARSSTTVSAISVILASRTLAFVSFVPIPCLATVRTLS